jgi:hypothetical protein
MMIRCGIALAVVILLAIPFGRHVPPPDYVSPEDATYFKRSCETAEASLKAAINDIEDFGVRSEQPRPTVTGRGRGRSGEDGSGSVSQTFHAPVTIHNQAIATDNAIQKIGTMGDATGASLKEIAELFWQSEDLTPRQVKEGLADIEALAVEVQKPEPGRNWKSILESGQKIFDIAGKATDLAHKLARYTPAVVELVEKARHLLK